jgi:phosphorylated CTD-interacting factor 1
MPKRRKKRTLEQADAHLLVPGLKQAATTDATVEDCLHELEGAGAAAQPSTSATSFVSSPAEDDEPKATSETADLCCEPGFASFPMTREQKERIQRWNRAFHLWQSSGTYTAGLLPSFDVELTRSFKVQQLSTFVLDACKGLKMPAFERWLIDTKLEEIYTASDPILTDGASLRCQSSQRLVEEILETGMPRDRAEKLVRELCRRTEAAVREVKQQMQLHDGRVPLKKGDRIDLEGRGEKDVLTLVYHRKKKWKKPFCVKINAMHYDKLRDMFLRVQKQAGQTIRLVDVAGKPTKATHAFHLILMVLLLRYSSLAGGQLLLDMRGGGMQGAVHGEVFQVLRETFSSGPLFECFASPLNAYLPSFGSAFANDLDYFFGSLGNFLELEVKGGCCEANPPFCPGMMNAMTYRIERNLAQADKRGNALSFVVIVPSAGDESSVRAAAKRFGGESLKRMTTSPRCRLHILLKAKEHGYVEGAQHMRPTRYKESLYDTSVVLLQSEKARSQELDEQRLEEKIRSAFASRHKEEVNKRRKLDETRYKEKTDESDSSSL